MVSLAELLRQAAAPPADGRDGSGEPPPAPRGRTRRTTVVVPMLAGEVMASLGRVTLMRRRAYEVLGLAFRPPQPRPLARVLRDGPFVLEQVLAVAPFRALDEAHRLLAELAGGPDPGPSLQQELASEYERLFTRGLCPPCEALFPQARRAPAVEDSDIRSIYRPAGFSPARVLSGPPDHAAVELAFMAELCRRHFRALVEGTAGAAERLAESQRRFLEGHLGRWLPAFAQAVRDETTSDFYRAAALALPVWIGLDRGFLRSIGDPVAPSDDFLIRSGEEKGQ